MPLQNLFLILLLPIIFYETLTACFKQVSHTKRMAYKTMTWLSFFVLIQLVLVTYEDRLVNHFPHFPLWILMSLFYGPYLNLILSTWHLSEQQVKYNKYLGDFYSMMCVFICGVFIIFMKSDLPYLFETITAGVLLSFVYYGVIIGKKIIKLSDHTEVTHIKIRKIIRWIQLSLSVVLVLLFFSISRDIKSSGLLFLLLFYVSLAFMRKNVEHNTLIHIDEGEDEEDVEQGQWEREDNYLIAHRELNHQKYGQTKLNEIVLQRCNIKVQDIIIENKAFLDANFKMTDLAAQTKISRYYLAQYFNVVHRMNFREYINKLRIDHVVQYINNSNKKDKLSVNDLFRESAFNSKTSFFKSFKHVLGCTPFEYLKKCQD